MSYLTTGALRADLEEILGKPIVEEERDEDDEDALAAFPEPLRADLEALRKVAFSNAPKLCVLTWGDFCSVPALYDEERDVVLDDWFDGDEKATDFVMTAVDVVNGGGGFYFVVNHDGRMGLVCEDPHSFDALECSLPDFVKALVAAHRAACSKGIEAAHAELCKVVPDGTAKLMLTFADRLAPKP